MKQDKEFIASGGMVRAIDVVLAYHAEAGPGIREAAKNGEPWGHVRCGRVP